jgi:hypothetical protein
MFIALPAFCHLSPKQRQHQTPRKHQSHCQPSPQQHQPRYQPSRASTKNHIIAKNHVITKHHISMTTTTLAPNTMSSPSGQHYNQHVSTKQHTTSASQTRNMKKFKKKGSTSATTSAPNRPSRLPQ